MVYFAVQERGGTLSQNGALLSDAEVASRVWPRHLVKLVALTREKLMG